MMDRRRFLLTSLVGALAAPVGAEAQLPSKVYRIAYLATGTPAPAGSPAPLREVFEQELRERGWETGKNLVIEYRYAGDKHDDLPRLAAELVRLDPHVIVATPTVSAGSKGRDEDNPHCHVGCAGSNRSTAHREFCKTGRQRDWRPSLESSAKQLQLLKEAVPRAKRIAFLRDPGNRAGHPLVKIVTEAARSIGVELRIVGASGSAQFEPAFREITRVAADAVLIQLEPSFSTHIARLAQLALRHRLPSLCGAGYTNVGGLMSHAVSRADTVRHAAGHVDRLLRGANPADLPVEQPTKFELIINLKTAKALGLTIPPSLLARADQVIE